MPQRIQCRRTRGWRKPEGAVYVGRPSKWGNPFARAGYADRTRVVATYRSWLFAPYRSVGPTVAEICRSFKGAT